MLVIKDRAELKKHLLNRLSLLRGQLKGEKDKARTAGWIAGIQEAIAAVVAWEQWEESQEQQPK